MRDKILFNDSNYPKSYASIAPGFYRLKNFLDLSTEEIEQVENNFWNFIVKKADSTKPRKKFKNYKFLDFGWEWSIFIKNDTTLLKIPAGLFPEVNTQKYLDNTKFAYQKILDHFPPEFVAKSKFQRKNKLNIFEQEFVKGKNNFIVGYNTKNKVLLENVSKFLNCTLDMLKNFQWLPDFDIKRAKGGFTFRNVIFEKHSYIPKIIDFTAYYDIYRMYPKRKEHEIKEKARKISDFRAWIKEKH